MEAGGAWLIRYKDPNARIKLWAIADIHYSNKGCDKELLAQNISQIRRDPLAVWTLLGDVCDWIVPGDPRWDPECVDASVRVNDLARLGALVVAKITRLFEPLKGRCLGVGYGNHDLKYYNASQHAYLHDVLCRSLNAPNLRYSGFLQLYFANDPSLRGRRMILSRATPDIIRRPNLRLLTVYLIHGFGAASTAGGKMGALKRAVEIVQADLVLMGHLHEQLSKAFLRIGVDPLGVKLEERPTVAMMTGSYLKGYPGDCTSYGEMRGLPPATLGATCATYQPRTGRLSVENTVVVGRMT